MPSLYPTILHFLQSEDGPAPTEYAVMLAFIVMVCIGAMNTIRQNANNTFTTVSNALKTTSS